jgi:predicted nucleic acid-binding protein
MRVAVDANIVAAALIRPGGWCAGQLARTDVAWVTPAFVRQELAAHEEHYAARAGCDLDAFRSRRADLLGRFRIVPTSRLVKVARHPLVVQAAAVDPRDAHYLALIAAGEADLLWTQDRALLEAFPDLAVIVVPPLS